MAINENAVTDTLVPTTGSLNITGNLTVSGTYPSGSTAPILSASGGLFVNNQTIGTTYSIPSGYSAYSAGPVSISSGVTITIPSGSRWVIL